MKKSRQNVDPMVSKSDSIKTVEKLNLIQYAPVRRHSRVLYLPLDPVVVRLHKIKKGDIIKNHLIELRRGPDENDRLEE